jgi:arylformamidase
VPDVDHFDELNVLVDSNSPFFKKSCDMIHGKGPNQ